MLDEPRAPLNVNRRLNVQALQPFNAPAPAAAVQTSSDAGGHLAPPYKISVCTVTALHRGPRTAGGAPDPQNRHSSEQTPHRRRRRPGGVN